jgi:hypothetical protein
LMSPHGVLDFRGLIQHLGDVCVSFFVLVCEMYTTTDKVD